MGGVLPDHEIRQRNSWDKENKNRIEIIPFVEATKEPGRVSWGLDHYGYSLRCGRNFRIFNDIFLSEVDPRTLYLDLENRIARGQLVDFKDVDSCVIPPNSFCLAETYELVRVPRDCQAHVTGKSTLARCGLSLTTTPIEPEWKGIITLEIANHTRLPTRIWAGDGIGQIYFIQGTSECQSSYADKPHALYQNQTGLTAGRT